MALYPSTISRESRSQISTVVFALADDLDRWTRNARGFYEILRQKDNAPTSNAMWALPSSGDSNLEFDYHEEEHLLNLWYKVRLGPDAVVVVAKVVPWPDPLIYGARYLE